jgi:hypothetical protein
MSHRSVFSFSTQARNGGLAHGRPRYQVVTQENTELGCGAPGVEAVGPVCIRVGGDGARIRDANMKTIVYGTLDIAKYPLDQSKMGFPWRVHV